MRFKAQRFWSGGSVAESLRYMLSKSFHHSISPYTYKYPYYALQLEAERAQAMSATQDTGAVEGQSKRASGGDVGIRLAIAFPRNSALLPPGVPPSEVVGSSLGLTFPSSCASFVRIVSSNR